MELSELLLHVPILEKFTFKAPLELWSRFGSMTSCSYNCPEWTNSALLEKMHSHV